MLSVHACSRASKRLRRPALLCGALLAVSTAAVSSVAIEATPARATSVVDVTAWAPYWKATEALAAFNAQSDKFSELTPFFFSATGATAVGFNANMANQQSTLQKYKDAATAKGKALIPTVVDAMGARGMAGVLADPVTRTQHVQTLLSFVVDNGFSGVDIDYESFAFNDGQSTWPDALDGTPGTYTNWGAFINELANALHSHVPRLTLAVSVPPIYDGSQTPKSGYWVYNFPKLAEVVDRVRVMTYSYSVGAPGPIAPYSWVSASMDAVRQIVPAGKLVLGIPAYGTDWVTNIAGTCPAGVVPKKKSVTTTDAAKYAYDRGAVPAWVETGTVGGRTNQLIRERTFSYIDSFTGPDANNITVRCNVSRTVWYADPDAIYQRVLLAESKDLVGVGIWALGYDNGVMWDGVNHALANDQTWLAPAAAVPPPRPAPPEPIVSSGPLPARYLDTRSGYKTTDGLFAGKGKRAADSVLEVQIAGRGPVPADATAATLNVTVLGAGTGFVTVYPCGARPTTSSLNVLAGQTISNTVMTKLSATGTVCIYTQQAADLVLDVFNVLPDSAFAALGTPARLLDTRTGQPTIDGQFSGTGALGIGSAVEVTVAGRGGISNTAKSAVLNVTAVGAAGAGYLTVWPCDAAMPTTSNVNYVKGAATPNAVVAALSATGTVCVYSSNATNVIVDVFGQLDVDSYDPLDQPGRLMETRTGFATSDSQFNAMGKRTLSQETVIQVAGRVGLPVDPTAVILNVTVDSPELPGYVTVYPCGTARPPVSNVNFAAGQTIPNLVVTRLAADGTVCVFTSAPTHVLIDVFGTLTI